MLTNGGWEEGVVGEETAEWQQWFTGAPEDLSKWWGEDRDMYIVDDIALSRPPPVEGEKMAARETGRCFENIVQFIENTGGHASVVLSGYYGGFNDSDLQIGLIWDDSLPLLPPDAGHGEPYLPGLNGAFDVGMSNSHVVVEFSDGVDTAGAMVHFSETIDLGGVPAYIGVRVKYGSWTQSDDFWWALDGFSLVEGSPPLAGDTDLDGDVDLDDLFTVRNSFGTSGGATLTDGDTDADGDVDLDDLFAVRNNFGAGLLVSPEPSALAMLCAGAFILMRRRKSAGASSGAPAGSGERLLADDHLAASTRRRLRRSPPASHPVLFRRARSGRRGRR